ncbi:hypothetical protein OIU84_004175 [Salix udensis]|uniref:Uncharacterized protein n=1 Tax=Salix udensis TaxID=889485 RepID=A0AAD6P452_9ROSI|nr:hypothetical protein OIU84_004175 [Salix udensis]
MVNYKAKHNLNREYEMKLVWSPETASKAYIDTVKSCELFQESSVAELISAMAAGWNAKLIVETWLQGGILAASIGLAIASRHTGGRHVCIVPDELSRSEYEEAMGEAGMSPEIIVRGSRGSGGGAVGHRLPGGGFTAKGFCKSIEADKSEQQGSSFGVQECKFKGRIEF